MGCAFAEGVQPGPASGGPHDLCFLLPLDGSICNCSARPLPAPDLMKPLEWPLASERNMILALAGCLCHGGSAETQWTGAGGL